MNMHKQTALFKMQEQGKRNGDVGSSAAQKEY